MGNQVKKLNRVRHPLPLSQGDRQSAGTVQARRSAQSMAWHSWRWNFVGLAITFVAVSILIPNVDASRPTLILALILAGLVEVAFLWRLVWDTLALFALTGNHTSRIQGLLGLAIEAMGTKSARKALAGTVTSTVLATGLFSGSAFAQVPETADTLWFTASATAQVNVEQPDVWEHQRNPIDIGLAAPLPNTDNTLKPVESQIPPAERPPATPAAKTNPSRPLTSQTAPLNTSTYSPPRPQLGTAQQYSQSQSQPAKRPLEAESSYEVVAGDSLWKIAQTMLPPSASITDIDRLWRQIYSMNRGVIGADPNHIEPGMTLALPRSLQDMDGE